MKEAIAVWKKNPIQLLKIFLSSCEENGSIKLKSAYRLIHTLPYRKLTSRYTPRKQLYTENTQITTTLYKKELLLWKFTEKRDKLKYPNEFEQFKTSSRHILKILRELDITESSLQVGRCRDSGGVKTQRHVDSKEKAFRSSTTKKTRLALATLTS